MNDNHADILVGIAALNDPDLPETVRHLFALSSKAMKVHIVALETGSKHGSLPTGEIPGFDPRWHTYTWIFGGADPVGAWPARAHLATAIKSLELTCAYGLSLDAHMRCASSWDRWLVDRYRRAPLDWLGKTTTAPVLSLMVHRSSAHWGDSLDAHKVRVAIYPEDWRAGGFLPSLSTKIIPVAPDSEFIPARHAAACSLFGPPGVLNLWTEHGDSILFWGEEMVLAYEVFRRGWGLWHCPSPVTHLSLVPPGRPWQTDREEWFAKDRRSFEYMRRILHADPGSCGPHCRPLDGGPVCLADQWALYTGLDYRLGGERSESALPQWMDEHYPDWRDYDAAH